MRRPWLPAAIGILLIVASLVGLTLAVGTLVTLPLTARQLAAVAPTATTAVESASAEARRKCWIGIAACAAAGLCGAYLVARRRRSL